LGEVHGHMYKTKLNMCNKQIEETWKSRGLTLWMVGVVTNQIARISTKATNVPIGR
jgi:hypothetical protein